MRSSRGRFLPLLALLALGMASLWWAQPDHASADVTGTDASVASFASGGNGTSLTISAQDDDGDLVIKVTEIDPSTQVTLSAAVCAPIACPGGALVVQDATKTITLATGAFDANTDADALTLTFMLNATCTTNDTLKVTAKQGDGAGDVDTVIFVQCEAPTPNISLINDALGAGAGEFVYSLSAPGAHACESDEVVLVDGEQADFVCDADDRQYTILLDELPDGWELANIACERHNVPAGDVIVSLANQRLQVTLTDDDDSVVCTFTSELLASTPTPAATPAQTSTPAPTATPSLPASIDLVASSTVIECNGSSSVTALVRDQSGRTVVNGTLVNFLASAGGGISAGTRTTVNGLATVVFNATTSSDASITAQSGGVSKSLGLHVSCLSAVAQAPAPQLPAPPASLIDVVIRPPNTGDGGLPAPASGRGMTVELALLGVSLFGIVAWIKTKESSKRGD